MTFFYLLVISPIEHAIEFVFNFSLGKFELLGIGGSIICVSMAVNFLTLPLYNIADSLQLQERNIQKKLEAGVHHIKHSFKGDERYMVLSSYYRLQGYNPLFSLRSSLSILIEIPFFIAAYHYLSNCDAIQGNKFLFLNDLGLPDSLLKIGNTTIHILPIIMTLINCASGFIYSKDAPVREKVQIYVLAAIFLVLLYKSPSGLVIYWILNNLFSLVKNVVQKYCKEPWKVVAGCVDTSCLFVSAYYMFLKPTTSIKKKIVIYTMSIIVIVCPYLLKYYAKVFEKIKESFKMERKTYFFTFLFSAASLALLCGALLPSSMINTSPEEFSFLGNTNSPLSYIAPTLVLMTGVFVVWPLAIYLMFGDRVKLALSYIFTTGAIGALCNSFLFKHNYGTINIAGKLNTPDVLSRLPPPLLLGPVLILMITISFLLLAQRFRKLNYARLVMLSLCLGFTGLTVKNMSSINHSYKHLISQKKIEQTENNAAFEKLINLNKNGQNVIVFFLDRAMGVFVPYIFEQFPELNDIYTGWTLYPNTVSFSTHTNEGMPPLYGGYEYSVDNMNLRADELLAKKSDESQLVVPRLFSDAGWETSLIDPQYPNYDRENEKTLFDEFPKIKRYKSYNRYTKQFLYSHSTIFDFPADTLCKTMLPYICLLQVLPPVARKLYYNKNRPYFSSFSTGETSFGTFLAGYTGLYYLAETTSFDSSKNSYTMFHNMTCHDTKKLKEPDYHPENLNENDLKNIHAKFPYKNTAGIDTGDIAHYECNATAFLLIAKWITLLKENNCYDNTRIIFVADHGANAVHYISEDGMKDNFSPLLMLKDFNASGPLKTDNSFMTNADTPWLSLKGLPIGNKNPFSNKEISEKNAEKEKAAGVNVYADVDPIPFRHQDDTKFGIDIKKAWHVKDNIYDTKNWIPMTEWIKDHPNDIANETSKGGVQ